MEEKKKGDWLLWRNAFGYIQVKCSKCGYRVTSDKKIPDVCPKCGAINIKSNE